MTTWLLLPLGVALGWAMARRSRQETAAPPPAPTLSDPLSDAAAEDLDAAPDVLLSMGNLFRRRGEIDRALRVHQALLARPDLDAEQRDEARYELAEDYQQAGLLDEAEAHWRALVEGRGPRAATAAQALLQLAEQARDWEQAVALARELERLQGADCRVRISHYLCEQAEAHLAAGALDEALRTAKAAQASDARAARPRWLQARILEAQGDFRKAVAAYQSAMELDPRLIEDVLPAVEQRFVEAGDEAGLRQLLGDLAAFHPAPALAAAQARQAIRLGENPVPVLAESLQKEPSRTVLMALLEVLKPRAELRAAGLQGAMEGLRAALAAQQKTQPAFVCEQCGFTPRNRFWQCPSCRQWGSIHRRPDRYG